MRRERADTECTTRTISLILVTELVSQLLTSGLKNVPGGFPQFVLVQRSNWAMFVTPDVQLFDRPSLSGGLVPASACRRTSEARSARERVRECKRPWEEINYALEDE